MQQFISAILTGSQAYGNPTEESDIDLVVLLTREDFRRLRQLGWEKVDAYATSLSLKFGKLNIIAVDDVDVFNAWREGTEQLKDEATNVFDSWDVSVVSRNRAVEVIGEKLQQVQQEKQRRSVRKVVMT